MSDESGFKLIRVTNADITEFDVDENKGLDMKLKAASLSDVDVMQIALDASNRLGCEIDFERIWIKTPFDIKPRLDEYGYFKDDVLREQQKMYKKPDKSIPRVFSPTEIYGLK